MGYGEKMAVVVAPQPPQGDIVPAPAEKPAWGQIGYQAADCCRTAIKTGTPSRTVTPPGSITADGAISRGKSA